MGYERREDDRRDVSRKKKKTARGWGTIFRQKMNRMIKLTKIEIVLRLRFLFHGTCMTDGTCKLSGNAMPNAIFTNQKDVKR